MRRAGPGTASESGGPGGRRALALDMAAAIGRHAASLTTGLITYPLIGITLGTEHLGAWALLGAGTSLVGLGDLGLSTPVQRAAVGSDLPLARRTLGLALRTAAFSGPLLALLSAPLLVIEVESAHRGELALAGVGVLVAAWLHALSAPLRAYGLARGGARPVAAARALGAMVQVALTGGLLLAPSLIVPALALLFGNMLELALVWHAARARDPGLPLLPRGRLSRGALLRVARDGGAALALHGAVVIAGRVDIFLVAGIAPLGVVAGYAIALRAVEQSFVLAKQTSSALLPGLGDPRTRAGTTRLGTGVLGALVGAGMVALVVDGPPLLEAWAGGAVGQETLFVPLALLAAGALLASLHEVACSGLTLVGRSAWAGATPIVVGSLINLGLGLSLAPRLGVVAIAGATVIGNAITFGWVWARARILLGWSTREVLRSFAPLGVALTVAAPVAFGLRDAAMSGAFQSLGVCALATGAGALAGGALTWHRQ